MASKKKRVVVFGVFDLLHPGHLYFLYHARLKGEELIVVIARDTIIKSLKKRKPEWNQAKRIKAIKETGLATKVILGDAQSGNYTVLKKYKPSVVCLGYDQVSLKKDLLAKMEDGSLSKTVIQSLKSYKPTIFHTSLRRKK